MEALSSPVRSQCSGNTGLEVPDAWTALGAVAEGPLQPEQVCCCWPSGCGLSWQGADERLWSPHCSRSAQDPPPPGPVPPGGSAQRPRAGVEYAPSPTRGSQRLGRRAGVRAKKQAATSFFCPMKSAHHPRSGSHTPDCVSLQKPPSISLPVLWNQNNAPPQTGGSGNSFMEGSAMKATWFFLKRPLWMCAALSTIRPQTSHDQ